MTRSRWALAVLVLLISACASTETSSAPSIAAAPTSSEALQASFDGWAAGVEGGGVAHVRTADGETFTLATGSDAASGETLEREARVRVGSISKVFTATLVMQLVDEGLVDLDEPVGTYLQALPVGEDVSVRQLLGHRSGIANYTETKGFGVVVVEGPDRSPTPTDLLEFVAGESNFDPGESFEYSNSNYVIAGLLVEAVDQKSLADSLAARITEPLGLDRTEFDDGTLTDVVSGHTGLIPGGTSTARSYRSIAFSSWAAGGLVTTVDELAVFLDALLFGDLVSETARDEMLDGLSDGAEYGLGLHPGPDFGVGHGGAIVGFNSIAEVDLDTREMLIVVVNNDLRRANIASAALAEALRGR